jgi:exodeoxyribonuclease VII large subunit
MLLDRRTLPKPLHRNPRQLHWPTVTRERATASQLDLTFEEPRLVRRIWPVRELVGHVKELVEREFVDVWVEGEISNCRAAPSGHIYFTLKDAEAQLPVVLFRRQAMLLRFKPEDGLHVLARGSVSVYEQRGQMQLVAETLEPVGAGSLQLAFEQLKERLKAEGLFDAARKRPLPAFPRTVGIVTSPTGAVIRDFLNIVGRRHSGLNVLLFPVAVQGEGSAAEIEAALTALNASTLVDLVVLARGGGSLEDLAAFNSERVARAIAASRLPVVSAIGHETDFTIADFVADLRAPTPSAAAELVTEAQHRIAKHLGAQMHRLERAARFRFLDARQLLARVQVSRSQARVAALVRAREQQLDDLAARLEDAVCNPLRALERHVAQLWSSLLRHDPRQSLGRARERFAAGHARLYRSQERALHERSAAIGALDARLRSLSPLAVLERGYALVLDDRGELVRSATHVNAGDLVTTRLSDGAFTSRVETAAAKSK